MASFWSFVFFVVSVALLGRAVNFIRRAKARHRAALLGNGWIENNRQHRLRQDRYWRVFLVTYALCGGILNVALNANLPSPILAMPLSAAAAFLLAAFVWIFHKHYVEITHPMGELALAMRDQLFHKNVKQLEPKGEHGTAEEVAPQRAGFSVSPIRWIAGGYQPVVTSGEEVAVPAEPHADLSGLWDKLQSVLGGQK